MQKTLNIEGKAVSFVITDGTNDSSPYLLFLHGLQSKKEAFDGIRQSLPFPHLAIDLIGFGQSDKPENFTYDIADQAAVVIQILNALKIDKVHIIGHSLGGMIGTLLLKELPDAVISLCSLEGNLTLADCGEGKTVADMVFDYFSNHYFDELKTRLQNSTEPSAAFRYEAVNIIPDFAFYKTAQSIVNWSSRNQLLDIFNDSKQPKLLMRGDSSNFASTPASSNLQTAIIPGSGHFMHFDNPVETTYILSKHLRNHMQ